MPRPKKTAVPISPEETKATRVNRSADKATETAVKQLQAGIAFKQPRMQRLKEIDDMYAIRTKPALAGRFNVPFDGVIMRGFVDTLMAKIDEAPSIRFKNTKEAALKAARKITDAAAFELSSARTNYNQKDRWTKKLAILSGRGINEVYGESDPEFKFCIDVVDPYDFVTEPNGGGNLDDHLFNYQMNVFRTKEEMKRMALSGYYDATQVEKLINWTEPSDFKENADEHKNKVSRFASVGLDIETNNYVGVKLFNLTKGVTTHLGKLHYIVFDQKTKIWVRFAPIEQVFESKLRPWTSWATDEDAFTFWNLGPADVIFPIAEARRVNLNGMLNNGRKIADDMIVYDQNAIPDPSKLIYAPDRLIAATLRQGQSLTDIVQRLAPKDITNLAVSLDQFLNSFQGQHSGITASAQGQGNEQLAAILNSNIQQVSDRVGLLNKSYSLMQEQIGRRFDWALYEHAPESYMVKSIGPEGAEWEELTKEDKDPDFEVVAVSSRAEQEQSLAKADKQEKSLTMLLGNERIAAILNPRKVAEEVFRFGGFEEEKIRLLLDTANESDEEVLSEAAKLIQNVLENKPVELYRGADTAFIQKIINYATKKKLEIKDYQKLMLIAQEHMPIAQENMLRKQMTAPQDPATPPTDPLAPQAAPPEPMPT